LGRDHSAIPGPRWQQNHEGMHRRLDLRGLGSAEGNVAQLLAHRFTRRGMSWSVNRADRVASLIMLGPTEN